MDKKNKKILGISMASIIATIAIIAPATYFGLQKSDQLKKDPKLDYNQAKLKGLDDNIIVDPNPSNNENYLPPLDFSKVCIKPQTKINYLAIGDSITAGFNSELGWEAPGRYDLATNKISGLSFPSFIAQYINKVEPNRLASYENLGLTGSRAIDWLYLLGVADANYFKDQQYKFFDFSKKMDNQENNPFKHRLKKFFNDFGYRNDKKLTNNEQVLKSDFTEFYNSLRSANLMTISLGANDFLAYLDINKLIDLANSTQNDLVNKANEYKNYLKTIAQKIQNDLKKLISAIKKVNPNISISLIGYPTPLLRLNDVLNQLFKLPNNQSLVNDVMDILNNAIKNVADLKNNVNYIDPFDENDWKANSDKFTRAIFDIHPTELGYKRMAQDIFLKMSLGQNYAQNKTPLIANAIYEAWDEDYFNKDSDSFKQQIGFANNTNQDLVNKVLGTSKGALFWVKTTLENDKQLRDQFLNFKNTSTIVKDWLFANKRSFNSFVNFISQNLVNLGLDKNGAIAQFLANIDENGLNNLYKLAQAFVQTTYLDRVISGIQNDFDNLDLDKNNIKGTQKISTTLLLDVFKKHVINDQNLFELLNGLFKSDFFVDNQLEIKKIVKALLSDLIGSQKLLDMVFGNNASNNLNGDTEFLKNILIIQQKLVKTKSLEKIIDVFVDALFDSNQNYLSQGPLSNVLAKIVSANKNVLSERLTTLFDDLLKDETTLSAVYSLTTQILNEQIPDFAKTENGAQIIKKIISYGSNVSLINLIKNNTIDLLTNPKTFLGIFDQNKPSILSIMQQSIDVNSKPFLNNVIDLLTSNKINIDDWKLLMQAILNSPSITNILNNGLAGISDLNQKISSKVDFIKLIKNLAFVLDEKNLDDTHKQQIKNTLKTIVDELFENPNLKNLLDSFEDFLANKIGDLLISSKSQIISTKGEQIWKVIKTLINKTINGEQIKNLLITFINNFIDQPKQYQDFNTFTELLSVILKTNDQQIQTSIDAIVKSVFADESTNSLISELIVDLMQQYLFKNNVSANDLQKLTTFIKNVLPSIADLTLYKQVRSSLFTFLKENLVTIINDPNKWQTFVNKGINKILVDSLPQLLTIVELIENDQIKDQDVIDVIKILIDNLDFNKLLTNSNNQSTTLEIDAKYLIFKLIKNFANSRIFKVENPKLEVYKTKLKTILETSINNVFSNTNLNEFFNDGLAKLLSSLDIFAQLNLTDEQRNNFAKTIIKTFKENSTFKTLLISITKNLVDNVNEYVNANDLESIISLVIKQNQQQLKKVFDEILLVVLKDEQWQDLILRLLVKVINPSKNYEDISSSSINKLKTFMTKFADGFSKLDIYKQIKDALFNVLSDPQKTKKLLSNDQQELKSIILEAFNINTPQNALKLIKIFDIDSISSRDYADVIEIILFEIGIQTNIKNNNTTSSNNQSHNNDFIFQVIKLALNDGIDQKHLTKLKEIINFVLNDIEKIYESDNFIRTQLNKFANSLVNSIIKLLPKTQSLENEYNEFFTTILNDRIFLNSVKDLLSIIINKVIDHKDQYKNANSFGELVQLFAQNKESDLKTKFKVLLESVLKNETIVNKFGSLLIKSFKLELNVPITNDQNEQNSISFIAKLLKNLTNLSIYNKLVDNFFVFVKSNIKNLIDAKPFDSSKVSNELINFTSPKAKDYATLIELFGIEEISADEWKAFIGFIIDYTPFNQLFNSKPTTPFQSSSTNTSFDSSKITTEVFEFIKAFVSSKVINDSTNTTKAQTNANKFKDVIEFLFDKLLTSNNTKNFIINLVIKQDAISSFLKSINIDEQKAIKISHAIINAIGEDKNLQTIFNALIEPLVLQPQKFANTTNLAELIAKLIQESESNLKPAVISIIKNLLKNNEIQEFVLQVVIPKINQNKTYNDLSQQAISSFKNLLTKLANHLDNVSVFNDLLTNLFTKLKHQNSINQLLTTNLDAMLNLVKELFNLNENILAKVIDILEIDDISAQEFVDVINAFVNQIEISFEKNQTTTNTNSESINRYWKYASALIKHNWSSKAKTKFKSIISLFIEQNLNSNQESFWTKLVQIIGTKVSNIIVEKISNLSSQKTSYETLIKNLLNNANFKNAIKNFIVEGSSKIIDNLDQLKDATSFGDLVQKLITTNDTWLKSEIKKVLSVILKEANLTNELAQVLINSYTSYFEITNLGEEQQSKLKNVLTKVITNVSDLKFVDNLTTQLIKFLKENAKALIDNPLNNQQALNKFINENIANEDALINLLEIFDNTNISVEEWNEFTQILIDYLPLNKILDITKRINQQNNQTALSVNQQITNVFVFIKKLLNSTHLNNVKNKFDDVIKNAISNLLKNNNFKNFIATQLTNTLFSNTNLINTLGIVDTKTTLIDPIINQLISSEELSNIIQTLITSIFEQKDQLKTLDSSNEFFTKLISLNTEKLKPNLKKIIQNTLKQDNVQELLVRVIFKQITPNKIYVSIKEESKHNLKSLISKFANRLEEFSSYNEIVNNLFTSLSNKDNWTKLFSNNNNDLIAFAKTIFDYTNPQKIINLIDVLKITSINDTDYIQAFKTLLDEVDFSYFINKKHQTNESNANSQNKLNINDYYKYVKALFNHELDETSKIKLKNIIKELTTKVLSDQGTGFINNLANALSEKISNLITKAIPQLQSHQDAYKNLVKKIFTNQTLFNEVKELIVWVFNDFIDQKNTYKSIKTFGALFEKFIQTHEQEIQNKLIATFKKIFSEKNNLIDEISTTFIDSVKTYFNITNLTNGDNDKIKQFIKFVFNNIFELEYVKNSVNKLITTLKDNVKNLVDNNSDINTIMQTNVVSFISSPTEVAKLFQIIKLDTNNTILNFLKVILEKLPTTAYQKMFGTKIVLQDQTATVTTNKQEHQAIEYIKAILNSSYLNDNAVLTKTKTIIKDLLTSFSKSTELTSYLSELIANSFAQKLSDVTKINLENSKKFLVGSYKFIVNDTKFVEIINNLIDNLLTQKSQYLDKLISSPLDVINELIKTNIATQKNEFVPFIKRFLKTDSTSEFIAQFIIGTLKLENTNNNDINTIKKFINELVDNMHNLDFLNVFIDSMFNLMSKKGLDIFIKPNEIAEFKKSMETFGLTDPMNLLKIAKQVNNNQIKGETIGDLINLMFEKSPLTSYDKLNANDHPLYYGLKNLKEESLTSVIFGNGNKKEYKGIERINELDAIQHLINQLWDAQKKYSDQHKNSMTYEQDNPYMRSLIHLGIVLQWYVHETYFRNTTGGFWWWGAASNSWSGEGEVFLLLKADKNFSEAKVNQMIMGNRSPWLWSAPSYWSYTKNDFLFMITYWKKHKTSRHTKKPMVDDIFESLKRGYGQQIAIKK
ncbi:GDSL-type esterase/lipase family protein [Ureaplasma urealyticum]|uniref:GDSL-type esterase/lipase family protein n=1 Tax=Ureaplasma urealyticum TaxID=2130 RepID=UPI0002D7741A|nr:GDSL-type esterase/lipase family protein [Ureaplasma urealyticum]